MRKKRKRTKASWVGSLEVGRRKVCLLKIPSWKPSRRFTKNCRKYLWVVSIAGTMWACWIGRIITLLVTACLHSALKMFSKSTNSWKTKATSDRTSPCRWRVMARTRRSLRGTWTSTSCLTRTPTIYRNESWLFSDQSPKSSQINLSKGLQTYGSRNRSSETFQTRRTMVHSNFWTNRMKNWFSCWYVCIRLGLLRTTRSRTSCLSTRWSTPWSNTSKIM